MAKAPVRARKRVRKQVLTACLHIHASSTTPHRDYYRSSGNALVKQQPAVPVSVVLANPLRLQLRVAAERCAGRREKEYGIKNRCYVKASVRAANLLFVL